MTNRREGREGREREGERDRERGSRAKPGIQLVVYKGIDTAAGCDLCFRTQSPAAHKTSLQPAIETRLKRSTYLPKPIEKTELTLLVLLFTPNNHL